MGRERQCAAVVRADGRPGRYAQSPRHPYWGRSQQPLHASSKTSSSQVPIHRRRHTSILSTASPFYDASLLLSVFFNLITNHSFIKTLLQIYMLLIAIVMVMWRAQFHSSLNVCPYLFFSSLELDSEIIFNPPHPHFLLGKPPAFDVCASECASVVFVCF